MDNFLELEESFVSLFDFRHIKDDDSIHYYMDNHNIIFAKSLPYFILQGFNLNQVKNIIIKDRMIFDPEFIARCKLTHANRKMFAYEPGNDAYICKY